MEMNKVNNINNLKHLKHIESYLKLPKAVLSHLNRIVNHSVNYVVYYIEYYTRYYIKSKIQRLLSVINLVLSKPYNLITLKAKNLFTYFRVKGMNLSCFLQSYAQNYTNYAIEANP